MNKKIYQSPCACAYKLTGKAMLSSSMTVNGSDKVTNSTDIGFVKEQNSQSGNNNVWDEEW